MRVQLLGGKESDFRSAFEAMLRQQCLELQLPLTIVHCSDDRLPRAGTPAARAVTVVFAQPSQLWAPALEQRLADLLQRGQLMLPVIEDPPASSALPAVLRSINAFVRSHYGMGADVQGLVDELLSLIWLRRLQRRVFISYRRIDSEAIAQQLFQRFGALGYEVFLDDATIAPALDFQRELKWWLNDADLLVALISPNFSSSRWCLEEIAFAQRQGVGILAVCWPERLYGSGSAENESPLPFPGGSSPRVEPSITQAAMPDQRLRLRLADFASRTARRQGGEAMVRSKLTESAWQQLLGAVSLRRSRALRVRMDNLMRLVPQALAVGGRLLDQPAFGDFVFDDAQQRRCFARVLPFRPRPEQLHAICADAKPHLPPAGAEMPLAGCLYAENDGGDERFRALRWLADTPRAAGNEPQPKLWAMSGGAEL